MQVLSEAVREQHYCTLNVDLSSRKLLIYRYACTFTDPIFFFLLHTLLTMPLIVDADPCIKFHFENPNLGNKDTVEDWRGKAKISS